MKELFKLLPQSITSFLNGKEIQKIDLGRSGCQVFYVKKFGFLKVSDDPDRLMSEKDRCLWLENRANAPKVLDFGQCLAEDNAMPSRAFLLTSEVKGLPLCDKSFLETPDYLIGLISEAMAAFHAIDAVDCPFLAEGCGTDFKTDTPTLCHGDFCLPNILYDGKTLGFVDVGGMGRCEPWLDHAWALWSLDYNLKTDAYRPALLRAFGIEFDEEKYRYYTAM